MINSKQQSTPKLGTTSIYFQLYYVFHLLFFVFGISIGMLACSYFKTFPSFLNFDSLFFSLPSSAWPPLPSPSPPPLAPLLSVSSPPSPLLAPLLSVSSPPLPVSSPLPPPPPVTSPPPPPPPISSPPPPLQPPPPPPSPDPLTPPPPAPAPQSLEILSSKLENNSIVSLMHNMSDKELFERATNVSNNNNSWELVEDNNKKVKKVAFMFLAYGSLPLAPLWEKYFKRHEGLYSIYVHPHPSHNDSWSPSSVFFGRRIPSQAVYWGTKSLMDAERRLLANALLDISNQRFILLSESCIPVMNFKTSYDYLINTNLSFVEIYDNPGKGGRGRYNPQMSPYINITHWRKGSQWFEATRDLAIKIISDQKYYKLFEDYCRPPCYVDEHYIPTLIYILYPELNSNSTITYVDWSIRGAHPVKFGWDRITEEFLNGIRYGQGCVYNGSITTMCFMFARKFAPNALEPLLRIAPLLLRFDP